MSEWYPYDFPVGVLDVQINGLSIGAAATTDPDNRGIWYQQAYSWTASAPDTTALITLVNTETSAKGNDFALDDIEFSLVPEPTSLSLLALGGLACLRRRK